MMKQYILIIIILLFICNPIRAQKLTNDQLTASQKEVLSTLQDLYPRMSRNFSGIKGFYEFYENKKKIQVPGARAKHKITDLSLFLTIPSLEVLELYECSNTTFSELSKIQNLKRLYISDHQVKLNLPSIFELKQLENLTIHGCNTITNNSIEGIENLVNLKVLRLREGSIEDLTPISKLNTINTIDITSFPIKNIGNWNALENLKEITLNNCNLEETHFINTSKHLTHINLNNNNLDELDIQWQNLKTLFVEKNRLTTLKDISKSDKLELLVIGNNNIKDLSILSHLKSLKILDAQYNQITEVCSLVALENLESLNIYNNPFKDASCLSSLPKLDRFDGSTYGMINPYPCSPQDIDELREGKSCNTIQSAMYWPLTNPLYASLLAIIGLVVLMVFGYSRRKK